MSSKTETVDQTVGNRRKWDKERWREYHRERYRRINNITPDKYVRSREQVKEDLEKLGKGAYEYHLLQLEKIRLRNQKKRPPKVECPICKVEVCDTEGRWRQHNNTIAHKVAQETLERHGYLHT